MIRKPISDQKRMLIATFSIFIILMLYSLLCSYQKHINPKDTTIPNLSQFVTGLKTVLLPDPKTGGIWLWEDAKATYGRHILGVAIGVFFSTCLGILMGCFPKVEAFFLLPISVLALIPPTAMITVYFVLFGTELKMFVGMVALGIFPTLTKSIYQAARNDVGEELIYKGYTFGGSNTEIVTEIVFRQVLHRILENIRLIIGPAMVCLIAAEVYVGDVGFGYRLRVQSRLSNMNVVYIYLFCLGLTGFIFDWLLLWSQRKLCPYQNSEKPKA